MAQSMPNPRVEFPGLCWTYWKRGKCGEGLEGGSHRPAFQGAMSAQKSVLPGPQILPSSCRRKGKGREGGSRVTPFALGLSRGWGSCARGLRWELQETQFHLCFSKKIQKMTAVPVLPNSYHVPKGARPHPADNEKGQSARKF
jgi:hypothetical protein